MASTKGESSGKHIQEGERLPLDSITLFTITPEGKPQVNLPLLAWKERPRASSPLFFNINAIQAIANLQSVLAKDVFPGKKVALVCLPGAFTPGMVYGDVCLQGDELVQ